LLQLGRQTLGVEEREIRAMLREESVIPASFAQVGKDRHTRCAIF